MMSLSTMDSFGLAQVSLDFLTSRPMPVNSLIMLSILGALDCLLQQTGSRPLAPYKQQFNSPVTQVSRPTNNPRHKGLLPKREKKKKKGKRVPPKVTWPPPRFSFIANTVIVKIDRLWGGESGHHPTQEAQLVCASATNRACHHNDTRGRKCQLWGLFLPGTTQSIFS